MTSRNKLQGRYAGCWQGKHVRGKNSQMAFTKVSFDSRIYWIPALPESETAWRVLQYRKIMRDCNVQPNH